MNYEDIKQDMQTLSAQEEVPKERPAHDEKPKQFFTVMTEVLMANLGESLKRLSFFKAAKYRKKLAG